MRQLEQSDGQDALRQNRADLGIAEESRFQGLGIRKRNTWQRNGNTRRARAKTSKARYIATNAARPRAVLAAKAARSRAANRRSPSAFRKPARRARRFRAKSRNCIRNHSLPAEISA